MRAPYSIYKSRQHRDRPWTVLRYGEAIGYWATWGGALAQVFIDDPREVRP
jgi:hypothetical protein